MSKGAAGMNSRKLKVPPTSECNPAVFHRKLHLEKCLLVYIEHKEELRQSD